MIYILAGIAKSGKSKIALAILEQKKLRMISTDWIMMMLYHGNKDLNIDIHKSDISVSHMLEPYIEGLIQALIDSKKDILIEGVHIQPALARKMMDQYPNKIRSVFLGYKEMDATTKTQELRKHAETMENPWYMSMNDHELYHLTTYMIHESEKLYQTCLIHKLQYMEVKDVIKDQHQIISALFHT